MSGYVPDSVLEIADITVAPGSEKEFELAYLGARAIIARQPGCRGVRLTRGIETPTRFVLLVTWDAVADHEAFRASDDFAGWRGAMGPFYAKPPFMEHVADIPAE